MSRKFVDVVDKLLPTNLQIVRQKLENCSWIQDRKTQKWNVSTFSGSSVATIPTLSSPAPSVLASVGRFWRRRRSGRRRRARSAWRGWSTRAPSQRPSRCTTWVSRDTVQTKFETVLCISQGSFIFLTDVWFKLLWIVCFVSLFNSLILSMIRWLTRIEKCGT